MKKIFGMKPEFFVLAVFVGIILGYLCAAGDLAP